MGRQITSRFLCLALIGFCAICCKGPEAYYRSGEGFRPKIGFVPDAQTAIRIATAILIPIYGEKAVEAEMPYTAELKNGVWTVAGTLPPNCVGGVSVVLISQKDGKVLYFYSTC